MIKHSSGTNVAERHQKWYEEIPIAPRMIWIAVSVCQRPKKAVSSRLSPASLVVTFNASFYCSSQFHICLVSRTGPPCSTWLPFLLKVICNNPRIPQYSTPRVPSWTMTSNNIMLLVATFFRWKEPLWSIAPHIYDLDFHVHAPPLYDLFRFINIIKPHAGSIEDAITPSNICKHASDFCCSSGADAIYDNRWMIYAPISIICLTTRTFSMTTWSELRWRRSSDASF